MGECEKQVQDRMHNVMVVGALGSGNGDGCTCSAHELLTHTINVRNRMPEKIEVTIRGTAGACVKYQPSDRDEWDVGTIELDPADLSKLFRSPKFRDAEPRRKTLKANDRRALRDQGEATVTQTHELRIPNDGVVDWLPELRLVVQVVS